jgi:putative flavoprotein involved in K+ transport
VTYHNDLATRRSRTPGGLKSIQTVIIGGGQAGLSVGYYLRKHGRPFVILDANERIGDAWRHRWDRFCCSLPPESTGASRHAVSRGGRSVHNEDEMADYLESYAARFEMPVRTGARVQRLSR